MEGCVIRFSADGASERIHALLITVLCNGAN